MRAGKIRIVFENPNTPEETCEYLSKIFAQKIATNQLKENSDFSESQSEDKTQLKDVNITNIGSCKV